jgi:Kef-type K+ transport system membrane component KefB
MTRHEFKELAAKGAALGAVVALSAGVSRLAGPELPWAGPIAAIGVFLLAGELLAELGDRFGLPHLTGYLAAGLLLGPHGIGVVGSEAADSLSLVNALALALIALSAGGELTLELLRSAARSLFWATWAQVLIAVPLIAAGFYLAQPWLPFLSGMEVPAVIGASLVWAVLAISRSPAATLGLIAQLRPDGPLTRYSLALVIAFDIVVLVLFSATVQIAQSLVDPRASFELAAMRSVGMEIVGSIAAGTTLGLLITAYLKLVGKQLILFLLVVAYGTTEFARYFNYDSLLLFVTAGFIVANVSRHGGERLLEAVSQGGRVTYVIFFALAGATLDMPLLLDVWPVAVGLSVVRVIASWLAARAGSRIANDDPMVRKYGWTPLVSQVGVTIGMALVVAEVFEDSFGQQFAALAIAVVGINQIVGPVLFKFGLDRAGETGKGTGAIHAAHGEAAEEAAPAEQPSAG